MVAMVGDDCCIAAGCTGKGGDYVWPKYLCPKGCKVELEQSVHPDCRKEAGRLAPQVAAASAAPNLSTYSLTADEV